jgi:hypothetical protein
VGTTPTAEDPDAIDLATPDADAAPHPSRPRARRGVVVVAIVAVLGLVAGGIAFVANDTGSGDDQEAIDTFAPDVTVGDANLVVLSTAFDAQGARTLIPASVVTTLGAVPGVQAAEGVLRTFVPVQDADGKTLGRGRSTVAMSWNGTSGLELREGRPPTAPGEVAVDVSTLDDDDLQIGDQVQVPPSGTWARPGTSVDVGAEPATIVGSFTVAGDDSGVAGVPLTAFDPTFLVERTQPGAAVGFDRVDLIASPDVDPTVVLQQVAAALPPGFQVVPATQLGSREQLRAELEIQRAFFDLLSLDEPTRNAAQEGGDQATSEQRAQGDATFQRYLDQLVNVELRVQRFSFLDADHARVVFMTYFDGRPSPVLSQPFDADVVRVDGTWKVSSATICTLTLLAGAPCIPQPGQAIQPPPGWQLPATLPEVVEPFTRFTAASATTDSRVAVLEHGEALRREVEAGVAADAPFAADATLVISGARRSDPDHAEIFYSLTGPGAAGLETPYPLVGRAVRDGGTWKVSSVYACGLSAFASGGCATPIQVGPSTATSPTSGQPVAAPASGSRPNLDQSSGFVSVYSPIT